MTIGFIGTGLMGNPMALRLLNAGIDLAVYNRTTKRTQNLELSGAQVCKNSDECVATCDAIVVMVSDYEAIEVTVLNKTARQHLVNTTVIQMSTIGPQKSRDSANKIAAAGGHYLEAPVLGSIPQATDGSLIVMAGGEEELYQRWRGLLSHFGPEPQLVGPVGSAAALKLCLNQLIASLTGAFALSLGAAIREDVPVDTFMTILRNSALYAPTFDKKVEGMLADRYTPANFPAKHLLKDVRLFLNMAEEDNLDAQALQGTEAILQRALQMGLADSDYSALAKAVWNDGEAEH
ncbi:MAG: NAD(P)-dependent oxidoreductase [bacterium]|nr:NAD(P)-dependent oxidoreductase [bacterium]